MDDRLKDLFQVADTAQRDSIDSLVTQRLAEFLNTRTASSGLTEAQYSSRFTHTELPAEPMAADKYLEWLFNRVVPHSVGVQLPRFIGHMTSALPSFIGPLERVMTTLNQNVVKLETSDAFTFYERQALGMLHRLIFGLNEGFYAEHVQRRESTLGMVVSGGTLANIAALWCARNSCLGKRDGFGGIAEEGFAGALQAHGYQRAVVIGSSLMHYSLRKAADLLGIGERGLIRIPARADGRIDLSALRSVVDGCRDRRECILALVGIAGTTETGMVDPLEEMGAIARKHSIHFHVDAAWGGPVLFSDKYRDRLRGIDLADSVTIDGHKQLYLPMGIGMMMLRSPAQADSIEKVANYIVRAGSADLGRRALEGSRPAMALFLHGALHIIGREGYRQLMDEGIEKAAWFANLIRSRPEFELLAEPDLNILVYRYIPSALREKLSRGQLEDGDQHRINKLNEVLQVSQRNSGVSFISRTTLECTVHGARIPIVSLRSVLANPLTQRDDLTQVLEEQVRIAAGIESQEVRSVP